MIILQDTVHYDIFSFIFLATKGLQPSLPVYATYASSLTQRSWKWRWNRRTSSWPSSTAVSTNVLLFISHRWLINLGSSYDKSLFIRLKTLGHDHSDTAKVYNNMAMVYDHQGEYEKALEWYEKGLDIPTHRTYRAYGRIGPVCSHIHTVYQYISKTLYVFFFY